MKDVFDNPEDTSNSPKNEAGNFDNANDDSAKTLRAAGEFRRRRDPPQGNQNARKKGFSSACLPPAQAEDIAMMRRRIAALIRDPGADPDLINRATKVLCRMMDIQRRYRFGCRISDLFSQEKFSNKCESEAEIKSPRFGFVFQKQIPSTHPEALKGPPCRPVQRFPAPAARPSLPAPPFSLTLFSANA